jgi:lipoic acid synthetase
MQTERTRPREPKPPWLKVRLAGGETYSHLKQILRERNLHTVCEEARCPNIGECWGGGTATFMLMGDTCTRGCRFCAVKTAKRGQPLDPDEPLKIAEAIAAMDLDYVVLTSVDRDDLPDGGADHFARTVEAVRAAHPRILTEVLIPDFQGHSEALDRLIASRPDVIAHNLETVARLSRRVRDARASYQRSLEVLAYIKQKDPARYTKSALMLGLGEDDQEIEAALDDLRQHQTDILTIGQYLQPTPQHLPVHAFIPPEKFAHWQAICAEKGFLYTASGPLVRSSYRAGELFIKNLLLKEKFDA